MAAVNGGTLFLEEVAELAMDAQVALQRLLADGTYTRVGETEVRRADLRIVAATCRDLPAMVEQGTFRADLFFRIYGAGIELPPLRSRSDFEALVDGFWSELG